MTPLSVTAAAAQARQAVDEAEAAMRAADVATDGKGEADKAADRTAKAADAAAYAYNNVKNGKRPGGGYLSVGSNEHAVHLTQALQEKERTAREASAAARNQQYWAAEAERAQQAWAEAAERARRAALDEAHARRTAAPQAAARQASAEAERAQAAAAAKTRAQNALLRFGVWGPTSAGKTTCLAALAIAAAAHRERTLWSLSGLDQVSEAWLARNRQRLFAKKFPLATEGQTKLRFLLQGTGRKDGRPVTAEFRLDVLDTPGSVFSELDGGSQGVSFEDDTPPETVVEHLAGCSGILMLFDPIRDAEDGDSILYVADRLDQLFARMHRERRIVDGRLPQHLSICITKWDDARVAGAAMTKDDWARLAAMREPVVDETIAARYFETLCEGHSGARYVRDAIRARFDPRKVRFYATSAVGFYIAPGCTLNPDAYQNVVEGEGEPTIVGIVSPMNVLEPVLDMASVISAERGQPMPWS